MIAVAVAVIVGIVAVTCGIVADSNHPDSLAFLGVMVRTTAAQIFLAGAICTWALFAALWLLSAGIRRSRERGVELRALRAAASGAEMRSPAEAAYAEMLRMESVGAGMTEADMSGMDVFGADVLGADVFRADVGGFDEYERMMVATRDERSAVVQAGYDPAGGDVRRAGTAPNAMPLIRGVDAIGAGRLGADAPGAETLRSDVLRTDAVGTHRPGSRPLARAAKSPDLSSYAYLAIPVRTETEVLGFPNTTPATVSHTGFSCPPFAVFDQGSVDLSGSSDHAVVPPVAGPDLRRGRSTGSEGVRGSALPDGSGPAGGLDGADPRRAGEPGGE